MLCCCLSSIRSLAPPKSWSRLLWSCLIIIGRAESAVASCFVQYQKSARSLRTGCLLLGLRRSRFDSQISQHHTRPFEGHQDQEVVDHKRCLLRTDSAAEVVGPYFHMCLAVLDLFRSLDHLEEDQAAGQGQRSSSLSYMGSGGIAAWAYGLSDGGAGDFDFERDPNNAKRFEVTIIIVLLQTEFPHGCCLRQRKGRCSLM